MIELLITLLIYCVIFGLIWWVIQQLPLPEPFGQIARVVFTVIACVILLYFLLGVLGHAPRIGLRL